MTIQQVQAQRERIRRAAGLLAVEHHTAGSTPDGLTIKAHAQSIYDDGIEQAEQAAANGAMLWTHAASMIADKLEENITGLQKVNTP